MPKLNLLEVLNEPEVRMVLDPFEFENYCGSCDNFCDPISGYKDTKIWDCPFEGKVDEFTDWNSICCGKYMN